MPTITGNEITPTEQHGSWIVLDDGTLGTPITGNEISPATRRGSWIILEEDTPLRRGYHHLGLVRGARGVG